MKHSIKTKVGISHPLCLFILVMLFQLGMPLYGLSQSIGVLSRWNDELVFLDYESGETLGSLSVGDFPHELFLDESRGIVYVATYGSNLITKVNIRDRSVLNSFKLEGFGKLHGLDLSNDGRLLWVTSEDQKQIVEMNTSSGKIEATWDTGSFKSHMLVAANEGLKLYVANIDSGEVSIISRDTGDLKVIKTGEGAEGIAYLKSKNEVWVSNRAENTISILNTNTDTIIKKISSEGDFPVKVKSSPDEKEIWVANNRSGTISIFDTNNYRHIKSVQVGVRPLGITFSGDNRFGFVTLAAGHEIVEIDRQGDFIIKRRIKAPSSPDGIVYIPE